MPISRNPRMDRRRRVLRDTHETTDSTVKKRPRGRRQATDQDTHQPKRSAGYSQDVRKACGQRLVQLIPVRRRSFALATVASLAIPALLLTAHYMIYVSGSLPWYGHPLAVALDASHRRGIASWFASHLWLLCLGATVLTFQLRRHKLDDYEGEYRLWFWLVITCLAASVDATTHITELFGLALDPWSQINLGWSGPAVVQATMVALIGMLGLRLCTELKSVPSSLVFWLAGLAAWAGSAALGQELLKIELSQQFRIWLKVALWLGGLTAVWLAALSYLRHVYIEAQQRFLLRGRLATSQGTPVTQRIRDSLQRLPGFRGHDEQSSEDGEPRRTWGLPSFGGKRPASGDEPTDTRSQRREKKRAERAAEKQRQVEQRQAEQRQAEQRQADEHRREEERLGQPAAPQDSENETNQPKSSGWTKFLKRSPTNASAETTETEDSESPNAKSKNSRFSNWLKSPKDSDEPDEYKKVTRKPKRPSAEPQSNSDRSADDENGPKKRWLPKLGKPKLPAFRKPNLGGLISKIRIPSFRLPPPDNSGDDAEATPIRAVSSADALPGTDSSHSTHDDDDMQRPMSKADRKRLRRQQRQNRAA